MSRRLFISSSRSRTDEGPHLPSDTRAGLGIVNSDDYGNDDKLEWIFEDLV